MMTPRERMKAVMNLKWPDMLLWYEKSYDETVVKWLRQGLPADKIVFIDWEVRAGRVSLLNWPVIKGFNPYSYFGCYSCSGLSVPLDLGPIPRFRQRVLEETKRYIDVLT